MQRKKISIDVLKMLYPSPSPHQKEGRDGLVSRKATKKHARHNHKSSYKAPKAGMSPAEWKRSRRQRKNK